jgi:pimeloyl-ACP methyl ester carboxylesterase
VEGDAHLYGYLHDSGRECNLALIPGSGSHHSIWEPVMARSDVDANILLVELPGFGKSRPRMPGGTIEEFSDLILGLIDAAGFGRFVAAGHSIGGMIAIEMIDHVPERLDGIISCEGWTHHSVQREAFGNLKNESLTPDQLEQRAHYCALARAGWSDEEWRRYTRIWQRWEKGRGLLERAEMPVLELWGDRGIDPRPRRADLQIPPEDNITLQWLPNAGHSYLVQFPQQVGQSIARFISEKVLPYRWKTPEDS